MYKFKNEEMKVPAFIWSAEGSIEESALSQISNLSKLPFAFHHIAIMPDCHSGYGMPIGGVLAAERVVIPNAVGVDIGCVDKDTEFLTGFGWKKISEYKDEKVMEYCPDTGAARLVTPENYIKVPCEKFIHFKTKYGIDQMVSEDHRCLVFLNDRKTNFSKYQVDLASEILQKHLSTKTGYRHRFVTTFTPELITRVSLTDAELRVMVMFCADGYIDRTRGLLRVKKDRKVKRAIKLLNDANIKYIQSVNKYDGVTHIRFSPPILEKGLKQFWNASFEQLLVVNDEVLHWDGNEKDQVFFTRNREDADFVQYVFSSCGFRSVLRTDIGRSGLDSELDYRVFRSTSTKIGMNGYPKTKMSYAKSEDGFKYCFTVPSGFFIARRNGNVFATGNCGMCALKTPWTTEWITKEVIKKLFGGSKEHHGGIRTVVPVGFSHHGEKQNEQLMPETRSIRQAFLVDSSIVEQEYQSALKQIGTLGGGNHFIEIQKDQTGFIWIMIHSGSRNIGFKVAKHYNDLAKEMTAKWFSSVPKESDLAFLPIDSTEGQKYLLEMQYCVEFALANRKLMMERIVNVFNSTLGGSIDMSGMINIAHNYATVESHFGKNVMVHRKGATLARENTIGIIPGSQGTKSYIVKGKGNQESFMSCSHGAGRTMSRTKAENTLNLEEEQRRLDDQGIIHGIRTAKDLDEAAGAYKPIDQVMKNQEDLVEIVVELQPLGVIKG